MPDAHSPRTVPTPKTKTFIAGITPIETNKSDASHIADALEAYGKQVSSQSFGVTKHIQAHEKKTNLLPDFIRVIGESSCISNYFKENLTTPSDGLKNAPWLLQMLGGEVMLAK